MAYGPGQADPPYPVPSGGPGGVWYADGSAPFPGVPGGPAPYAVHPGWLAATADRERTVGVLRAAFTEGRLSQDELDERVARAYASRTYGDLWQLTSDLPSGPLPYPAQVPAVMPFPQDPATMQGAQVSRAWSSAAALVITALVIFTLAALVTAIATAHTGQPIGGFQHVQHAYLAPYITADGNA